MEELRLDISVLKCSTHNFDKTKNWIDFTTTAKKSEFVFFPDICQDPMLPHSKSFFNGTTRVLTLPRPCLTLKYSNCLVFEIAT